VTRRSGSPKDIALKTRPRPNAIKSRRQPRGAAPIILQFYAFGCLDGN
jgi:hypothetical protein